MAAVRMRFGWMAAAAMAVATACSASAQMAIAHIYPPAEAARADIQKALVDARREHKRVILDFGGDWCGDCQVLNYYMHQSPNKELLVQNYILVDVNIGHIDQNLDIAAKYGVPLTKGVPALAVLRPDGTVVYAQKNGQFEDFRHMQGSDLTTFLAVWKPHR